MLRRLRDTEAEVVLKGETFQWRPCLRIYTDGSKSKKGVGCGLVVYDHLGNRLYDWKVKLNHESEIFQAELRALREAIQLAWQWGVEVDIFSDSLSVLQNVNCRKGYCSAVGPDPKLATWCEGYLGEGSQGTPWQ